MHNLGSYMLFSSLILEFCDISNLVDEVYALGLMHAAMFK